MKRFWFVILAAMLWPQVCMAQEATLSEDLTEVEEGFLFGDDLVESAVLPEGLKSIGRGAFSDCALPEMKLPDSLTMIADDAFDGPDKVKITAKEDTYAYQWALEHGYIFTYEEDVDGTLTITGYLGNKKELTIPEKIGGKSVTSIGPGAFLGNTKLRNVSFPDTLRRIGAEAFKGCSSLSKPVLPLGLKEIDDRAFDGVHAFSVRLPRSLTYIGKDVFTGYWSAYVYAGTYSERWAGNAVNPKMSRIIPIFPSTAKCSTEVAIKGEQVTCFAENVEKEFTSFLWQRSFDSQTWTECEGKEAHQLRYTFTASAENCGCLYRLAGTDFTGTYYGYPVSVAYLGDDCQISGVYVNGTTISLNWGMIWEGITYTLYMTGPDGVEKTVAESIRETFMDITNLEPETTYTFRLSASYKDMTVESAPVTVTTQGARTGRKCRALLIGQEHYQKPYVNLSDCPADLNLMSEMLRHVTGPQGTPYSYVRKMDLTADEIHQAIQETFADAGEDDVSLFYITAHGMGDDSLGKEYIGALVNDNPSTGKEEYIKDTTLAEWLSEVPGTIVVILDACSSGSMIYDEGEALTVMSEAAVSAFREKEQALFWEEGSVGAQGADTLPEDFLVELGGLRRPKFYVLTACEHLKEAYSSISKAATYAYFTDTLTRAVGQSGAMPCDIDGDGMATLSELANYIENFKSPVFVNYTQHVQAYPAGSDYVLFFRQ